jgi:hypothetical protein
MRTVPPPVGTLAGLLVGLWLLVILGGGVAMLAGHLLARLIRARRDRRHPQQAAARERTGRLGGWRPSGPYSPRPCGWAIRINGPASTASQPPSSSLTTRA